MKVPITDVRASNAPVVMDVLASMRQLAEEGQFILGTAVEELEWSVRAYLGAQESVAVSSGSDALVCALSALGVGVHDEVITTSFSFFATVESVIRVGATPRLVDIRPETFELDYELIDEMVCPATRAVLAVHLYGQPARVDRLRTIADRHGIALIEDVAQAFGARLQGRYVGTFGTFGCFSFQPTKPLGAWGDCGLLATDDSEAAKRCREIRSHGASAKHNHLVVGGNYRMDAIQALVLSHKLPLLSEALKRRRFVARAYSHAFAGLAGLRLPREVPTTEATHALYTIRVLDGRRDVLREFLAQKGIETAVHYPIPLHRQPALIERGLGSEEGSYPEAERAAREVLSLPIYPELSDEQRDYVIAMVKSYFEGD